MSRTLTAAPTDRSMWRRLLHVVHPDKGGDAELFVWVRKMSHSPAVGMVKSRKEMQGFGGGNSRNYAELREM